MQACNKIWLKARMFTAVAVLRFCANDQRAGRFFYAANATVALQI